MESAFRLSACFGGQLMREETGTHIGKTELQPPMPESSL
jgi:hypothetical protein